MAVRDDDPVDVTLEGALVVTDTGNSQVLLASAESPLAKPGATRGFAPPPVTLPDMPATAPSQTSSSGGTKKKATSQGSSTPTLPPSVPLKTTPSAPKPVSTGQDLLAEAPPAPDAPRASYNAAATVVASFADIAAAAGVKLDLTGEGRAVSDGIAFDASEEGGFIFDASAEGAPIVEDHGFGDSDGATRPDIARFQDRAAPPAAPVVKVVAPPVSAPAPAPAPAPASAPKPPPPAPAHQTSLPPPKARPPAPADQSMLPPPTSLPGSPSFSMPRSSARPESRGGAGGALDPPVPPPAPPRGTRTPMPGDGGGPLDPPVVPRKDARGLVQGVGGPLDPSVSARRDAGRAVADGPTDPTRGRKPKKADAPRAATDVIAVAGSEGAGGGRKGLIGIAVVLAVAIAVVVLWRGDETTGQAPGPREAREFSERARAVLVTQARSDVEDPVRGIVRTLVGESGRAIVVREAAVDAWALPDGTLVVTDGLLRRLGSDGQLAAVCAHTLAHHQLGHVAGLSDALDGPAVIAALRAPWSFDEAAADRAAAVLLVKGGWKTSALVDAQAAVADDSAWATRHPRRPEQIVGAVGAGGGSRDDRDWYRQKVLDVLTPPTPQPTPTAPTTAPTPGD